MTRQQTSAHESSKSERRGSHGSATTDAYRLERIGKALADAHGTDSGEAVTKKAAAKKAPAKKAATKK